MEAVNKQGNLTHGMVLVGVYMALLELYIFSYKFGFFPRLAAMSPCKSDTPTFVNNKDKLGDKRYERECWFLFTYIILI